MAKRKCNAECLCLKCMRSCMKGCKNCNPLFNMGVRKCPAYLCECVQLVLSDYLNEIKENIVIELKNGQAGTEKMREGDKSV